MNTENNIKSKDLYKLTLSILKVLPMVMVFAYFLMLGCFYYTPKYVVIPHLLGTVFAPLAFVYITSYVFRFCSFHRIFIHYYAFISVLNVTDHYFEPYFNDDIITLIHDGGTIIFIILASVMYFLKYKRERCLNKCNDKLYDKQEF